MALDSFLKLKGQKQGQIRGSVVQKGREGYIEVSSFSHLIDTPVDATTNQVAGRRKHHCFSITKPVDQSSIALYNALIQNEVLTSVELLCFTNQRRPSATGIETNHYTITLTNARIVSIQSDMFDNNNPELTRYEITETIKFVYEKIAWLWTDKSLSTEDDVNNI